MVYKFPNYAEVQLYIDCTQCKISGGTSYLMIFLKRKQKIKGQYINLWRTAYYSYKLKYSL